MNAFLRVMKMVFDLLRLPMNIYGFTFSLWDVIMFGIVVTAIFGFVRHMFYEN